MKIRETFSFGTQGFIYFQRLNGFFLQPQTTVSLDQLVEALGVKRVLFTQKLQHRSCFGKPLLFDQHGTFESACLLVDNIFFKGSTGIINELFNALIKILARFINTIQRTQAVCSQAEDHAGLQGQLQSVECLGMFPQFNSGCGQLGQCLLSIHSWQMEFIGSLDEHIQSPQALFEVFFSQIKSSIIVVDHPKQKRRSGIIRIQL